MSEIQSEGLPCVAKPRMRWLTLGIAIIGYVLIGLFIDERVLTLTLVFWTYFFARMQLFSPDLVVFEHGVEVNRYGFKTFLRWQDIRYVRVSRFNSQIFPTTIPRWIRFLMYDSLLINSWRDNYKKAFALIQERTKRASEQSTQRVYE